MAGFGPAGFHPPACALRLLVSAAQARSEPRFLGLLVVQAQRNMPHQVSRVLAPGYVVHEATLAAGEPLGHILRRLTYGLFCAVNFFGQQEDNDRIC